MEHTKHIWRAALALIALFMITVVVRHFMIPESFGEEGFYRASSMAEFMGQPVVHGSATACARCHEEQQDDVLGGAHATISCQTCHPPVVAHSKGDEKIADLPVDTTYKLCDYCHQKLVARPATMSQILKSQHLVDMGVLEPGEPVPERACQVCHDSHTAKERS